MFCGSGHRVTCSCVTCTLASSKSNGKKRNRSASNHKLASTPYMGASVRKPDNPFNGKSNDLLFSDSGFKAQFPNLHQYLSATQWDDKTNRITATLTIMVDNGALKVFLNDRHFNRSVCINEETFAGALDVLEEKLEKDEVDWRVKRGYGTDSKVTPF